jgi:NADH:ubiquinone oxidoreductase subunit 4 (subunit M)
MSDMNSAIDKALEKKEKETAKIKDDLSDLIKAAAVFQFSSSQYVHNDACDMSKIHKYIEIAQRMLFLAEKRYINADAALAQPGAAKFITELNVLLMETHDALTAELGDCDSTGTSDGEPEYNPDNDQDDNFA